MGPDRVQLLRLIAWLGTCACLRRLQASFRPRFVLGQTRSGRGTLSRRTALLCTIRPSPVFTHRRALPLSAKQIDRPLRSVGQLLIGEPPSAIWNRDLGEIRFIVIECERADTLDIVNGDFTCLSSSPAPRPIGARRCASLAPGIP